MSSSNWERLAKFSKNCVTHAKRLARRIETPTEALQSVAKDARHLTRSLTDATDQESRKQAYKLVKRGAEFYNLKQYPQAEDLFRRAILLDARCAIAFTYLGHSLYRQGRRPEAVTYWTKACEVDPDSDAAAKARRKLQHLANQKAEIERWFDSSTTGFE